MPNGNRKGKAGERELAKFLNDLLGTEYRRSRQYCGTAGDADLTPEVAGVHIECKRCQITRLDEWLEKAADEVADINTVPLVCFRQNNRLWKGVFYLGELVELSRAIVRKVGMGND